MKIRNLGLYRPESIGKVVVAEALSPTKAAEETFLGRSIGVRLRWLSEKIEAWKGGRVGLGIVWKTLTLEFRSRDEGHLRREGEEGAESSIQNVAKQQQQQHNADLSPRLFLVHGKKIGVNLD